MKPPKEELPLWIYLLRGFGCAGILMLLCFGGTLRLMSEGPQGGGHGYEDAFNGKWREFKVSGPTGTVSLNLPVDSEPPFTARVKPEISFEDADYRVDVSVNALGLKEWNMTQELSPLPGSVSKTIGHSRVLERCETLQGLYACECTATFSPRKLGREIQVDFKSSRGLKEARPAFDKMCDWIGKHN